MSGVRTSAAARPCLYEFSWASSALGGRVGAAHLVDLPFFFNNLDAPGVHELLGEEGGQESAARLAHGLSGAAAAFVRTGDPSGPLGDWPAFTPDRRHISDRVVVLYRGRIMEEGAAEAVCDRPAHPYTRSLLASVPVTDVRAQRERRRLRALSVATPRTDAPEQSGCPFADRCPFAAAVCSAAPPPLLEVERGRLVACVRIGEIAGATDFR